MKQLIKKFLKKINIDVKRIDPEIKNELSFDDIYQRKINYTPIIFDVGANRGQSIERFKKIFPKSVVHSFEPVFSEYSYMKNKYKNDNSIIINNFALGEISEQKKINVTAKTSNSSFNDINLNTRWIKKRSLQFNTTEKNYIKSKENVKIITLDDYCNDKNVDKIDILKIDTQGYEDKILNGSKNMLKSNKLSIIELEIMFDNVYNRHLNFIDIEKFLIPNDFRLCAIRTANQNLFEGLVFFADVVYFNKKKFDL